MKSEPFKLEKPGKTNFVDIIRVTIMLTKQPIKTSLLNGVLCKLYLLRVLACSMNLTCLYAWCVSLNGELLDVLNIYEMFS